MSDTIDFAELRDSARDVLTAECDSARLHKFIDGEAALAGQLWQTMAGLGWPGLMIPESYDGLGLGSGDLMAIYYELGRCCAPSPLLGSMLVAQALLGAGPAQRETRLPGLASGALRGAVWGLEHAAEPQRLPVVASAGGDTLRLDGELALVVDARQADLLLLPVRDAAGRLSWILLETSAAGIGRQPVAAVDRTHSFDKVVLRDVSVSAGCVLAGGEAAVALGETLLNHAALAVACDSIGGAEAIFERTVAYLNVRKQFNRLIGSFQALKHRCADLKVALVAGACSVEDAVQEMRGSGDGGLKIAMAKACATDVYARVAAEAVQLHGGIGFTWEQDCHIFLKRAKLNQQLFGAGHWYRDRTAALLLRDAAAQANAR